MTRTPRWIAACDTEAAAPKTKMPWERGVRREAFIAKRRVREVLDAAMIEAHIAA